METLIISERTLAASNEALDLQAEELESASTADETAQDDAAEVRPALDRGRSTVADDRSRQLALMCARIADDYRGGDTVVLDLTGITPIFDYFVISTGTSRRQSRAIAEEVDRVMNENGSPRLGLEGYDSSEWIVQDYGDVVLHVFSPESRELYDLEHLWADARRVEWQQPTATATAPSSADADVEASGQKSDNATETQI
ncbi:MAG: ribosome silencing factor [Planctomycetota bacterium]|nr:ribosome silencing factor [Planctomycetota bacterium]